MCMASRIIQVRLNSARRQVNTVKEFLTTPKGVFETVDQVVRNFRRANRETLATLGVSTARLGGLAIGKGVRKILGL